MADYFYPSGGQPQTVHFDITGKRPVEEEAKRLTGVSFPQKPVSESEIKKIVGNFFKFLGISILCLVIGFVILSISRSGGAGSGKVGFMGIILMLGSGICFLMAFGSLFGLLSTGRKKKAQKSFQWVWQDSILDNDTFKISDKGGKRFGSIEYALDKIERAVPSSIDRKATNEYITRLRENLIIFMEKTTSKARSQNLGVEGSPLKSINFENETEIFPNVYEIRATITYQDILDSHNAKNELMYYITAIIELHVKQIFIKTGKYWYPYDLTPDFRPSEFVIQKI